ncbi:hypothetical protein H8356DRAFT_1626647 [Neocallimastix lanati (nom. inval.)]|jgi:hypothetical protein|uniref:Uncharacterized protein n=1 Tax=Neocallimastix californiae TaxID=1754190 RepID=A0A1Y2DML2_9FUNG|nr:hypothetical protein H8356DRAFT_1626647 [Neocallimastix sp. JGI-2020a]ORY60481.1 hypothetical protein LY90DRAFT_701265 [Neocallimastix californiae]|eukprot:ORY60481.1 hypothetical protein LY90DRAFT_701265 [Neocallimastix californiae]
MFLFSRGKLPKLIKRLGYDPKEHKVESEVPIKRKRADSKVLKENPNDSMISESSSNTKVLPTQTHKLRRTKKHENLREEWKKYHNNFIPVIPADSSATIENVTIISKNTNKSTIQQSSYNNILKNLIKDNFNKNNYIKLEDNHESKIPEHHVAKKRRLFSFISH